MGRCRTGRARQSGGVPESSVRWSPDPDHRGASPPVRREPTVTRRDVILNELAQGLRPIQEGVEWFDALSQEKQYEVLRLLSHHCLQARAVEEDGPESIRRAGLRPTHTSAVLITRSRIDQQL